MKKKTLVNVMEYSIFASTLTSMRDTCHLNVYSFFFSFLNRPQTTKLTQPQCIRMKKKDLVKNEKNSKSFLKH